MVKVKIVHIEYRGHGAYSKRISKKVSFHTFESITDLHQTVRTIARNSPLHTTLGTRGDTIAFASSFAKGQYLDKYIPVKTVS